MCRLMFFPRRCTYKKCEFQGSVCERFVLLQCIVGSVLCRGICVVLQCTSWITLNRYTTRPRPHSRPFLLPRPRPRPCPHFPRASRSSYPPFFLFFEPALIDFTSMRCPPSLPARVTGDRLEGRRRHVALPL